MFGGLEIGLVAALVLALDIYAIWLVLNEDSSGLRKVFWIAMILIFQIVGMILYLVFFRRDPAPRPPAV